MKTITSPIFILFAIFIVFGIAYFSLNNLAQPYSTHISPDGNYKIIIYKYPVLGTDEDGPGFLRFFDLNTSTNIRKPLGLVSIADSIQWHIDAVSIGSTLSFPLSMEYPVKADYEAVYAKKYLLSAIQNKNLALTQLIVQKVDPQLTLKHLETAVSNEDSTMVQFLITQPDFLHYINSLQTNVMNDSNFLGHTDMIQLLIELGVSTNFLKREGASPLLAAVQGGHSNTVLMLLKNGVNVSCYSGDARTVFSETGRAFQRKIRKLLKENKKRCWALETPKT